MLVYSLMALLAVLLVVGGYFLKKNLSKKKLTAGLERVVRMGVSKSRLSAPPGQAGALSLPRPSRNGGDKYSPIYSTHSVDYRQFENTLTRSREMSIAPYSYHKNDAGLFVSSDTLSRDISSTPQGWGANWSPKWCVGGVLKTYVSNTPSDSPQGGGILSRLAHRPDLWAETVAANKTPGVSPVRSGNIFTWTNLFPDNGTLELEVDRSRFRKIIKYPGMPTTYPILGISIPESCTLVIESRQLRFLDENGDQYMHSNPAIGWWGCERREDAETTEGAGLGGIDLVDRGTAQSQGKTYRLVELIPDSVSWETSSGIVRFDPDLEITGNTVIDMNMMIAAWPTFNYGNRGTPSTAAFGFDTGKRRITIRTDEDELPSGTITAARYDLYWPLVDYAGDADGTQAVYKLVPGNSEWIQGTGDHGAQTGSPCWDFLAYDATIPTDWVGATGGLLSGTDYDATPGSTFARVGATHGNQYNTYTIPTAWIEDWRANPGNNAGVYLMETIQQECHVGGPLGPAGEVPKMTISYVEPGVSKSVLQRFITN